MVPGLFRQVIPLRAESPLLGLTCPSTPGGIATAIPVGTSALPAGGRTTSPSRSANRSIPEAPSVWYAGRSPRLPSCTNRTGTVRPGSIQSEGEAGGVRKLSHRSQREFLPAQHFRRELPHRVGGHRVHLPQGLLGRLDPPEKHLAHRHPAHPELGVLQREEHVPLDQVACEGPFLV